MERTIRIGKSAHECDIVIPNDYVSRIHAEISIVGGQYVYHDISKNGTVIGGRIYQNARVPVASGAEILLAGRVPLPWSQVYAMLPLHSAGNSPTLANRSEPSSSQTYQAYSSSNENQTEEAGVGWIILAFLIPLVGLILYFVWHGEKPKKANGVGIAALSGFIINLLIMLSAGY